MRSSGDVPGSILFRVGYLVLPDGLRADSCTPTPELGWFISRDLTTSSCLSSFQEQHMLLHFELKCYPDSVVPLWNHLLKYYRLR